ncbi:hypothetical protein NN561_013456 [Cricetulus griseus]
MSILNYEVAERGDPRPAAASDPARLSAGLLDPSHAGHPGHGRAAQGASPRLSSSLPATFGCQQTFPAGGCAETLITARQRNMGTGVRPKPPPRIPAILRTVRVAGAPWGRGGRGPAPWAARR